MARVMTPPASGLELPAGPYDTGENCATNDDDVMRIWPGAACRENENGPATGPHHHIVKGGRP